MFLALRVPGAAFSGATGLTKGLATGEVVPAAGTRPDSSQREECHLNSEANGLVCWSWLLSVTVRAVTLVPPAGRGTGPTASSGAKALPTKVSGIGSMEPRSGSWTHARLSKRF